MGLPPAVTIARGSYDVRPAKSGLGLCNWLCSLRVTYNVRKDMPRRIAWTAFLAMLRLRMTQSQYAQIPPPAGPQNPGAPSPIFAGLQALQPFVPATMAGWAGLLGGQNAAAARSRRAWLTDFNYNEGMYLDSKTITFSATWRLITTFGAILLASGLWKKVPTDGGNTWRTSVRDISGWTSWASNRLDPAQDVIVDFGFS